MGYPLLLLLLALVGLALSGRYAWWRPPVAYDRPRILMYHMIGEPRPGARFNKLRVSPAAFERQLAWLRHHGWHFLTMGELAGGSALPQRSVAITFDDGYADNYHQAHPLLQRYGARATLYLVVDRFGRDWSGYKKAHHDSGELMREPKLSDAQVEEMLASGVWELGGHTLTHANLATTPEERAREEVTGCRAALESRFGVQVTSFAYPFGIYGPRDVGLVRAAGFATAVTTEGGIDRDPGGRALELRRIKVSGRDGLWAFRLRLRGGRRGWRR